MGCLARLAGIVQATSQNAGQASRCPRTREERSGGPQQGRPELQAGSTLGAAIDLSARRVASSSKWRLSLWKAPFIVSCGGAPLFEGLVPAEQQQIKGRCRLASLAGVNRAIGVRDWSFASTGRSSTQVQYRRWRRGRFFNGIGASRARSRMACRGAPGEFVPAGAPGGFFRGGDRLQPHKTGHRRPESRNTWTGDQP